jgi:hypothetical protein
VAGKIYGNESLGKMSRQREDNIKKDLSEIGWEGVRWIYLAYKNESWRLLYPW